MTAIVGTQKTFDKKFLFRVEIAGVQSAAFESMSGLEGEVADVDHWEGGVLIANKAPGRISFPDITLMRGATSDRDLYNWWKQVAAASSLLAEPDFKRTFDLVQLNRVGVEIFRWTLVNAYPKKFKAGEWSNSVDEVVMHELVLRYDFFFEGGDLGL